MEIFHINAALGAAIYAIAAVFSKQALSKGAGILRLSFVVNLVFLPLFSVLLFRHELPVDWANIYKPLLAGVFFFAGQVFTFAAIRVGDVSLQTPIMGTKAVFAVVIVAVCGIELVSISMFVAALIAMLAVALLGLSGDGAERVGASISLAVLSSLFFAGSDVMVGAFADSFGVPAFLFFTFITNTLLSFCLIPFFREPLRAIPRAAWPWMCISSLLMGAQALLLNYTLGSYQHVAEINILYSTRGLWSVIFGVIAIRIFQRSAENSQSRVYMMRFTGALMMCVAIGLLFYPKI